MLQVDVLQSSFDQVLNQKADFAASFYERLFAEYPQTSPLFANTDMKRQQNVLIGALSTVLKYLRQEQNNELAALLADLGRRHASYGVTPENYPMVGAALLGTFASFLGDEWTPDLNAAWTEAYGAVVSLMQPQEG